jgi:Fe-S cluster biogenesis protein NfuA
MPSWFSNIFNRDEAPEPEPQPGPAEAPRVAIFDELEEEEEEGRRVVEAPVLIEDAERSGWSDDVRIKAAVKGPDLCVLMVDRPVLDGYSFEAASPEEADESPLAQRLLAIGDVGSVLIHGMTVTITRENVVIGAGGIEDWEPLAQEAGAVVRDHLKSDKPVVSQEFIESVPPEETIRARLEEALETHINPGIAAHSGRIRLDRVEGNTAYIEMQGGCQGCAASQLTLREGVEQVFRDAVPELGALLDVTDHSAGRNPYFTELPGSMA